MQSFKGREKARRYAMQALYGWALSNNALKDIESFYLADRNPKNFDLAYFLKLLHEIPANLETIDSEISAFIDRPFAAIDPIELSILRVAIYELKNCFDVPFRVAIHEAVELGKVFGADDTYKFINSVLDKAAKYFRASEVLQYANS